DRPGQGPDDRLLHLPGLRPQLPVRLRHPAARHEMARPFCGVSAAALIAVGAGATVRRSRQPGAPRGRFLGQEHPSAQRTEPMLRLSSLRRPLAALGFVSVAGLALAGTAGPTQAQTNPNCQYGPYYNPA